jgi:hypothetical protein
MPQRSVPPLSGQPQPVHQPSGAAQRWRLAGVGSSRVLMMSAPLLPPTAGPLVQLAPGKQAGHLQ